MLELGSGASAQGANDNFIKDGTDASFMADVVEASKSATVIVDFQAEWCGPCKTLGPVLEEAVRSANGAARLVRIDIDQNPQFASQLRVQSIPAVFAFVDGQPVDGFMGAVPASEAKAFVDRVAKMGGGGDQGGDQGGGLDEALDAADEMLAQSAASDAAQTFAAILGEDPGNARAVAGLASAFFASGQVDQAKATLDAAPPEIAQDARIAAVRAQIDLAEQAGDAGETEELRAKVDAAPDDHQARYDLALALLGARDTEGAIAELLELFRRDREWSDAAARAQLLKIFESLGDKDPVGLRGRRRLSSMIFV